ncbi:MAG: hypothetical protein ACREDO_01840 [Methyloceanibacter sp.]
MVLGFWAYSLTDDILAKNGPPLQAMFEMRLPAGSALPATSVEIDLNTDKNTMPATFSETSDGGKSVLAGSVDLYFRTSSRIIVLRLPDQPNRLLVLRLSANPKRSSEYGPRQRVEYTPTARWGAARRRRRRRLPDPLPGSSAPIDCQNAWLTWTEVQLTRARSGS